MHIRNSPTRYGALAKLLHWLTVVLVLLAWTLGTFIDDLPRGWGSGALAVHIAAGLAVIASVAARLLWRVADRPPPPEVTRLGPWGERAGRLVHVALYLLLFAIPVVGIVLQFARGQALPVFGLFEIASPWPADRVFARSVKELHGTLANIVVILAALHAAAALLHHFVLRDGTLRRMLPGRA